MKILITGTLIKKFFECGKERELRKSNIKYKGFKWGKICEQIYIESIRDPTARIYDVIQAKINENLKNLTVTESSHLISGLETIIKLMKSSTEELFHKSNFQIKNNKFSIEIDTIIMNHKGLGFIREIKSYQGPLKFAWNSDIMQLTVQNMVLSDIYCMDCYYGEIAYIGNGRIIQVNTKPYEKAVNFAYKQLMKNIKKINCKYCNFLLKNRILLKKM